MRTMLLLSIRLLIPALGYSAAVAQDLSDVLPALRTSGAPGSVTEGLRLTYDVAVATVNASYLYDWMDNTGTGGEDELPSPSGHGYTQVDVLAVTPQVVALRVQPWLFHNFTGPIVPVFGSDECLIGYAGGGDWYAHPAVLSQVAPVSEEGFRILRLPLNVGGRTYDALRIQRETDNGKQVLCYDLSTGYLIYKAAAVKSQGGVTLSQASLVGSRQIVLPWAGATLPGWVATTSELLYEGTYTVVSWGANPFSAPLSARVKITGRDDDWFVYDQTTTLGGLPNTPPSVGTRLLATGVNHLGGLCLPPDSLAALRSGQRIDTDDRTAATVDITFVGVLSSGRRGVTLRTSAGSAAWAEVTYDAVTGVALQLRTYDGPSPLYYSATEVNLTQLPSMPPAAPRLSLLRDPAQDGLTLSMSGEAGRSLTLLQSYDGGRNWTAVPGYLKQVSTGAAVTHRIDHPQGACWFRVRLE